MNEVGTCHENDNLLLAGLYSGSSRLNVLVMLNPQAINTASIFKHWQHHDPFGTCWAAPSPKFPQSSSSTSLPVFAEEQGQESDELRLEFGTFDATRFLSPQSRRKPETQTLVIQDLFPFSMFRSLEKRCFYGLRITFGHRTLWNFPVLPSAPWNKDRILQLIGKFNSTAGVDSWGHGLTVYLRFFSLNNWCFTHSKRFYQSIVVVVFLWRVISKCPPQLNGFLGSPQHTIYLKTMSVVFAIFAPLC